MLMIIPCPEENLSKSLWENLSVDCEREDLKGILTRRKIKVEVPIQSKKNCPNIGKESLEYCRLWKFPYIFRYNSYVKSQKNGIIYFFSRAESPIGDSRPVERAIEARNGSEDGQGSMVRCLHFAHTYIANRKYSNF